MFPKKEYTAYNNSARVKCTMMTKPEKQIARQMEGGGAHIV